MPAGMHIAFLIVALILFALSVVPTLKMWSMSLIAIGLVFFVAAFLVS